MNTVPEHHPDMKEEGSGLTCFMDKDRACGPDCMSFLSVMDRPEGDDYKGKQWASCHLLVNAHRGGKHLVILASAGADIAKKAKDQQRMNQTPPPVVR